MNKAGKTQYAEIQTQLAEVRLSLHKLGFNHDENQFSARKEKVFAYQHQEIAQIEEARKRISSEKSILQHTEKILQKQEVSIISQQYPEAPGINRLSYKEALSIQALNQSMGRKVSIPEIYKAFNQQSAEMERLVQQREKITNNAERLRIGEQWLAKYEKLEAEARKLFRTAKSKHQLKDDMVNSTRMLKEHGIADRKDYNKQLNIQRSDDASVSGIDQQISMLQPGLNLIQGAVRALRSAEQRSRTDQQRDQWTQKRRGIINSRENDRDLER